MAELEQLTGKITIESENVKKVSSILYSLESRSESPQWSWKQTILTVQSVGFWDC